MDRDNLLRDTYINTMAIFSILISAKVLEPQQIGLFKKEVEKQLDNMSLEDELKGLLNDERDITKD